MHIAVFYQHYHTPDCPTAARPYSLVQALAARHRVTLIASSAFRQRRITRDFDWVPPGVDARWIDVSYANAMATWQRTSSYARYAAWALVRSRTIDPPDLIFGSSTPLTVGLVAAGAARYWDVPWVFEVRDLWPDFPIQMGAIPLRCLQKLLYAGERWLYRDAAHVIATSPDQAHHVQQFTGAPGTVSTVAYGTEMDVVDDIRLAEVEALRQKYHLAGRTVVLYAGTFGRANALPMLVQAAIRLARRDDVCFVFAGHGHYASMLQRAARHTPTIRVLPAQPRRRALTLFRLADLSLVPFVDIPVLATNSPSKLYDSLATGTPALVTSSGWTRHLVERHRCGWFAPASDPVQLARRIAALLDHPAQLRAASRRAVALARRRFDRTDHMKRLVSIIESVVSPRQHVAIDP